MSLILSKSEMMWIAIAGWSAVIMPSMICGRLASQNYSIARVFSVSVIVLVVFGSVQMIPMWQMMASSGEVAQLMMETDPLLSAFGNSAEYSEQIKSFLSFFLRVVPALSILSVILQFAIGFRLFAGRLSSFGSYYKLTLPPFVTWRIAFSFTPLLLLGVVFRLFGNETMMIIADNMLLILSVFYSFTALALFEFFMKRFHFSIYLKLLVYLLLILSHIIGFALLVLLGFVDSFFDWRRKYPLPSGFK
jgi:hypothetical protein